MIAGFGNNVISSLAADITAGQTTIQVMPGTGAIFAGLLSSDYANASNPLQTYAKITLTDAKETVFEICHLTSVNNDMLTVVRGQEGTTAKGWALNDVIANFATRGSENQFIQIEHLQSGHYISGIAGGTANALTLELPATYFVNGATNWTLRTPIVVYPVQNNTGATTLQLTMGGRVLGTFSVTKGNNMPLGAGDLIAGVPVVLLYNEKDKRFQAINAITETGAVKSVNTHKPDASGNVKLGTAANIDTGTSGEKVPLLNNANTWSEKQTINNSNSATTDITLRLAGVQHTPLVLSRPTANANLSIGFLLQGMAIKRLGVNLEGDLCYGEQENQGANPRVITQAILDNKGLTVGGPTTLKGNTTVTNLTVNSTTGIQKNGAYPYTDGSQKFNQTDGLFMQGVGDQYGKIRYTEMVGVRAFIGFEVKGGDAKAWYEFRNDGTFYSRGATFGSNITISWGGRTATYQENGDVNGVVWGGTLSSYITTIFNKSITNIYQGSRAWVHMGQIAKNWTAPGGHFLTGINQKTAGGDTWIEDIEYAPLWKVTPTGQWII